jgi:hypothetical protein
MESRSDYRSNSMIAIVVLLGAVGLVGFGMMGCQSYTTGLQKTRGGANVTAVIGALQTIAGAQRSYAISHDGDYGTFKQLSEDGFLDARFNSEAPQVQGYVLTMNVGEKTFSCNADPGASMEPPGKHFYIDSTTTQVHVNPDQPATADDPLLNP